MAGYAAGAGEKMKEKTHFSAAEAADFLTMLGHPTSSRSVQYYCQNKELSHQIIGKNTISISRRAIVGFADRLTANPKKPGPSPKKGRKKL